MKIGTGFRYGTSRHDHRRWDRRALPGSRAAQCQHRRHRLRAQLDPHRLAAGLPHPDHPHGSRALHDCLEPASWQAFLDTVSRGGGGFGFTTEKLQDLLRFRADEVAPASTDPADRHYELAVSACGRFSCPEWMIWSGSGKTFESYEVLSDGRVTACFADGTSDTADLPIGADGANSRVRRQLLPHAERKDTGIVAVAGKHRLTEESRTRPRIGRRDCGT